MKTFKPKQCINCFEDFMPTGCNQKICVVCAPIVTSRKAKELHLKTYVRKGYNQKGDKNNAWNGGIGIYRTIKKATKCERCESTKFLLIHHKDRNRRNNDFGNLECLCKRCHQLEHDCVAALPKGERPEQFKQECVERAKRRQRDAKGHFTK